MIKIGVIGTINRDTIVHHNGEKTHGWGGILYNLKICSDLASPSTEIYPVCNIGRDCYPDIMKQLRKLPHVSLDYVNKVPEKNNHCHLTYGDPDIKTEILKGGVPPLKFDSMRPLLNCDLILINFISGRDIYLKSLKKLRREYKEQIYIDTHSYTLGKRVDGRRFLRTPRYWPEIVDCGNFIQLNRLELAVLAGEHENFIADDKTLRRHINLYYRRLRALKINHNSKYLIITENTKGCYLSYVKSGKLIWEHFPPGRKPASGDTTGCGDCFSSGFMLEWLKNQSPDLAANAGNRAARRRIELDRKFFKI